MGPRSIDRGTVSLAPMPVLKISLQWGRDQLIAELTPFPDTTGVRRPASMGPRSIDRGTLCWRVTGPSLTASMGPRSIDRGMRYGRTSWHGSWLQWGRDQLIAELTDAFEERRGHVGLQWGRDQLIAGLPRFWQLLCHPRASMGPRSIDRGTPGMSVVGRRESDVASMGPRSIDRGTANDGPKSKRRPLNASMGPRSIDRGTIVADPVYSRQPGLDGAAINRSRN